MWWYIGGFVAFYFIFSYIWNRFRDRHKASHDTTSQPKLSIIIEASTKPYDRNAYRFDGNAFPEFEIEYVDADGVVTNREIYVENYYQADNCIYYRCWCFLRDERRSFRSDRILKVKNISTGRKIKDIAAYLSRY